MRRWSIAAVATLVGIFLLTACASAPPRDEVAERVAIELEAATDVPRSYWTDAADGLAGDALDGKCGDELYISTLEREAPDMAYAFGVTCLMYFEGDLSQPQRDAVKQEVLERATKG